MGAQVYNAITDKSRDRNGIHSKAPTSPNQMEKQVERGQAPKSVSRVDRGKGPFEKDHVHFKDGYALNKNGTWKHDGEGVKQGGRSLTKDEKSWLEENGWQTPDSESPESGSSDSKED